MSVQINQYIGFGKMLDGNSVKNWETRYGKDFYSELERFGGNSAFKKEIAAQDGLSLLYDGMNGVSHFIGRIIKKTTSYEFMGSFSFSEIKLNEQTEKGIAAKLDTIIELQDFKSVKLDYHFITSCN